MLQQLKNRISDIQSIGSIELQLDTLGNATLHWLILSKKKQVLHIEKSGTLTGDWSSLPSLIPTSIPLVLSLSGKGVLHKKVQQPGDDKNKLFDYVFPNARINDYLVQYVSGTEQSHYVSVVRKEQVEQLSDQIRLLGYDLLSLSLGAFSILSLWNVLQSQDTMLVAGKHHLSIVKHTPSDYSYASVESQDIIEVADEKLPSFLLVPYAMAFQYLIAGIEKVEVESTLFRELRESYSEKKLFKVLWVGGLSFFFGLLVVNTIAYSLLTATNNRLSASYSSMQHITVSAQKNTEEFNQKEAFLSSAGWLNPAAVSFYSDRLASSLPQAIQLTGLSVYPLNEQRSRKDKKEIFESNKIVITGVSSKPTDINDWVKQLNDFEWISQVKVQDYTFDHKTGRGNFSLHIVITGELE